MRIKRKKLRKLLIQRARLRMLDDVVVPQLEAEIATLKERLLAAYANVECQIEQRKRDWFADVDGRESQLCSLKAQVMRLTRECEELRQGKASPKSTTTGASNDAE